MIVVMFFLLYNKYSIHLLFFKELSAAKESSDEDDLEITRMMSQAAPSITG